MFNWFWRFFEKRSLENPAVPLTSAAAWNYLGAPRSSSGVAVDRQTILSLPAVWRALDLVSHKIGRLPLHVYRRNKDGGREVDLEHPGEWVLNRHPSDLYTPVVFRSTLIRNALVHGSGFAWILRDEQARPEELIILDPLRVVVALDKGQLWYYVKVGDETRRLLPENMLHVKGAMSFDGIHSVSILDALREPLGISIAAQRYQSVFFRNGQTVGPLILSYPQGVKLDKEQQDQLRQQLERVHQGLDNSWKPLILGNGAEAELITPNHEQSQFLQTREFEIATGICNIFGIPPWKCGIKSATASYNSYQAEEQAFLNDTLDSWLVSIEQEADAKLLKVSQRVRDSHFVAFDRRHLEQADTQQRHTLLLQQLNGGGMTFNEYRAALNEPGIGESGDVLRIPTTVQVVDLEHQPVIDQPETDEPDPIEEEPAGPTPGDSPVQLDPASDQPVRSDQSVKALLRSVVGRYLVRLEKAAQKASQTHLWASGAWLDEHRAVIAEGIGPVQPDANGVVDVLLAELRDELAAVTRDQIGAVFSEDKADNWTRRILAWKPDQHEHQ